MRLASHTVAELAACKTLAFVGRMKGRCSKVEEQPVHGCNACAVHFGTPTRSSSSRQHAYRSQPVLRPCPAAVNITPWSWKFR